MQYSEFVGQVQHRAGVPGEEEAVKSIRATLETLSERLAGDEHKHLAAQLPDEIGRYLTQVQGTESFTPEEFVERVRKREGSETPEATHHVRTVFSVLQEAVSAGEFDDVRAQLPDEYETLFRIEGQGQEGP